METPALLKKAQWIWPALGFHDLHNSYACFRKIVTIESIPEKAIACLTADQCYKLQVNGHLVCRGPARGYQHSWPFDEVDLSPYLKTGSNLISVRAYNAGHSTFGYRSEGFAGLLFAARIGRQTILSDATWKCIRQSARRDTMPYSLQLPGHQEVIDLQTEDSAWQELSFNDSNWPFPERLHHWNSAPYFQLESRGLPLMRETRLRPICVGIGSGDSGENWKTVYDLALLRANEPLEHRKVLKGSESIRIPATSSGKFRSYLFDFGKVVVGSLQVTINNATGGERIDFLHTEVIHSENLSPKVDTHDHSRVRLANRMICRKGSQRHAFFHHLGFRYLTVTVRENKVPLELDVELESCGYPMEGEGSFSSSDAELERIWQACAHTQRICTLDAYVDTPWREQAQWWGDARIQAWNTFHLSADSLLLRRGIRILADQVTPDGLTYGHAPTIAHHCILPDFSLIWILTLWDDYWQTGSTVMFESHLDRVATILDYFRNQADSQSGLIRYDPRNWLFLDWTDLQKEGQPAVLSLWLLYCLQKLSVLVNVSGKKGILNDLLHWRKSLTLDITRCLLAPDGLVCDGLNDKGKQSRKKSLHAQTLAWICDLPGFDRQHALDQIFLPWLCEDRISHARPSAYWCAYPLDLLARHGYGKEVVAFIKRHWKQMADFGSTFENFDAQPIGGDMLSHSHAWSAHPLYLLMQILGGVRQAAPGWAEVHVDATVVGNHATIIIPTPRGVIRSWWECSADGQVDFHMEVPDAIRVIQG